MVTAQLGDGTSADHGWVRFIDIGAEVARLNRGGWNARITGDGERFSAEENSPCRWFAATEPDNRLNKVSFRGQPLHRRIRRQNRMVDTGSDFDAGHTDPTRGGENSRQRRCPGFRIADPPACPAPARIRPKAIFRHVCKTIAELDSHMRKIGEIILRYINTVRVQLASVDEYASFGESEGVRPYPTSHLAQTLHCRTAEDVGMMLGSFWSARLFEPVGREQHRLGTGTELADCSLSQPCLCECGRDNVGIPPVLAELYADREDIVLAVLGQAG